MNLQSIRKQYDFAVGLGSNCTVAYQLKRLGLRKFAAPLDSLLSSDINKLNEAIENDFEDFMKLKNMKLNHNVNVHTDDDKHFVVLDTLYDCYSGHEFPNVLSKYLWFAGYPSFKKRINRRIRNLLTNISQADSILFVRTSLEFEYEGVLRLKEVLRHKTKKNFNILAIKYGTKFEEINCSEENICFVEIPFDPYRDDWKGSDATWNSMLGEVTVKGVKQ